MSYIRRIFIIGIFLPIIISGQSFAVMSSLESARKKGGDDLKYFYVRDVSDTFLLKMIRRIYYEEIEKANDRRNKLVLLRKRMKQVICLNINNIKDWTQVVFGTKIYFLNPKSRTFYFCDKEMEAEDVYRHYLSEYMERQEQERDVKRERRRRHSTDLFFGYGEFIYDDYFTPIAYVAGNITHLTAGIGQNYRMTSKWKLSGRLAFEQESSEVDVELGYAYKLEGGVSYTNSRRYIPYAFFAKERESIISVDKKNDYRTVSQVESARERLLMDMYVYGARLDYAGMLFENKFLVGFSIATSATGEITSVDGTYSKYISMVRYKVRYQQWLNRSFWIEPYGSYSIMSDYYDNTHIKFGVVLGVTLW